MADQFGNKLAKDYMTDVPFENNKSFYVKGMENMDWGMKSRLAKTLKVEEQ